MTTCTHGVNPKYCKACNKPKPKTDELGGMTPKQIGNWRKVLYMTFGPYALLMPVSQILAYKDKMQNEINKLVEHDK